VSGQGFSLGHGFLLIPAKMVSKIQRWEFVNMSELLTDNLELARRSAESRGATLCATLKSPKKRELSEDWRGLIAWSVCFNTFAAIVAKKFPAKGPRVAGLLLHRPDGSLAFWLQGMVCYQCQK
jgi:hypothetical protein